MKTGPPASKFAFRPVPKLLSRHGVDVGRDDCLQNIVPPENQMCNGLKPWRGPREKSVVLMEMLIEACSDPGNIVFDCTAATGMFLICLKLMFSLLPEKFAYCLMFLSSTNKIKWIVL